MRLWTQNPGFDILNIMKRLVLLGFLIYFVASLQSLLHAQAYTYDLGGRLLSATYTGGVLVKYTYDAAGNISQISTNTPSGSGSSPVLTITSPVMNTTVNNSALTISGTASDSASGLTIKYQVNGGPWLTATGTANWQISLNLASGTSYIQIYATDSSGNTSPIDGFSVTYTPSTQTQSGEVQSEPLLPAWGEVGLLVGVVVFGLKFLGRRARPVA